MSLRSEEKNQLIKHADFFEAELADFPHFAKMAWEQYAEDRNVRRNIERWIENLVNCSIDMAKVLIISEGLTMPRLWDERSGRVRIKIRTANGLLSHR